MATLERSGAANVGGLQRPVGTTAFTRAVALAMTMTLGAGDARYRLGGGEGPADTVFLGVFRREALEAVGGFDETLLRNEDYELNWRLREGGRTVWFDPGLEVAYRPRWRSGLAGSAALAAAGMVRAGTALPAAYLLVLAAGSALAGLRRRNPAAVLLPAVLATMHLAWAAGFWCATASRRRGAPARPGRGSGPRA